MDRAQNWLPYIENINIDTTNILMQAADECMIDIEDNETKYEYQITSDKIILLEDIFEKLNIVEN